MVQKRRESEVASTEENPLSPLVRGAEERAMNRTTTNSKGVGTLEVWERKLTVCGTETVEKRGEAQGPRRTGIEVGGKRASGIGGASYRGGVRDCQWVVYFGTLPFFVLKEVTENPRSVPTTFKGSSSNPFFTFFGEFYTFLMNYVCLLQKTAIY